MKKYEEPKGFWGVMLWPLRAPSLREQFLEYDSDSFRELALFYVRRHLKELQADSQDSNLSEEMKDAARERWEDLNETAKRLEHWPPEEIREIHENSRKSTYKMRTACFWLGMSTAFLLNAIFTIINNLLG